MTERAPLLGCSVANGLPPCVRACGGGWPGTRITHEQMLRALELRRTAGLKCGTLLTQAEDWYRNHPLDSDSGDGA